MYVSVYKQLSPAQSGSWFSEMFRCVREVRLRMASDSTSKQLTSGLSVACSQTCKDSLPYNEYCLYTHTHTEICIYTTCMCAFLQIYMYMPLRRCVCVCLLYIYMYTHTCIHICTCLYIVSIMLVMFAVGAAERLSTCRPARSPQKEAERRTARSRSRNERKSDRSTQSEGPAAASRT